VLFASTSGQDKLQPEVEAATNKNGTRSKQQKIRLSRPHAID